MIPKKITILSDGLAFDIIWELFSRAEPAIAIKPMSEILMMNDAIPGIDIMKSVEALNRRQKEILTTKFKKMMITLQRRLAKVIEGYFDQIN